MIELIAQHRDAVASLCRRHMVARLEVFGSAATGDFQGDRSDLDFLVIYQPQSLDKAWDCYWGLKTDLESLFGRPVDLIDAEAMRNPYFIRSVNAAKELVYAA